LSSPSVAAEMAPLVVDAVALQESSKHIQSVSPKAPHLVPRLIGLLEAVAGASLDEHATRSTTKTAAGRRTLSCPRNTA